MDFKALFSQLSVVFTKLSKAQKIIVAGAVTGIVAFLVFLVVYTSKSDTKDKDYDVLFEKLSNEDAQKVLQQLDKEKVPYKIEENNVIKIPKSMVYKERIAIASTGIPSNKSVGFELFDTQEFGATSFDQNVKYLRALEGELSRTISALDPVDGASVSLAIPKETLFVSKESEPTASVVIKLKEGRTLTSGQIRGIKNLVASAVPKLKIENVALVDGNGDILGDSDENAQLGELSVAEQKYKAREEKKSEQKIVDVLAPFLGGDSHVVAKVTIEYDFSQISSTSEKYDPENVVRSEQTSEEKREGSTPVPDNGGVPGTVSNIGPVQGMDNNKTSTEKYTKTTGTTNYEISKTVSTEKEQFARIKRITAAVVVDGKYQHKMDKNGKPTDEMEYVALDQTQLDAINQLVSQSIGINQQRGDQVSIKNFEFKNSDANSNSGANKFNSIMSDYIAPLAPILKYLLVALVLFVLYKKVISPFAEKMLEVSKEEDTLEKPILDITDDEDEDLIERVQEMRKKVEDQLGVGQNFNEDELKYDVLLEKLKSMAEEHPDDIAMLIQSLITEEASGTTINTSKNLEG